jgi:hypothetical protein
MIRNNFNIIGFGFDWDRARGPGNTETYRYCSIHPYKRLIESKTDNTVLFCPECGSEWKKEDTVKEQDIQTDIPPNSGPKIIQGRNRKKKQIADDGNEVLDPDLQGFHVLKYNETGGPTKEDKGKKRQIKVVRK